MILALIQASALDPSNGYVEIIWWDYLKLLGVLALMVAGAWAFLRYAQPRVSGLGGASDAIRVLARYPLEPRKTLYVVRVGEETLLVGTSDNSIELLKTLPSGSFPDQLADPTVKTPSAFLKTLLQLRSK